MRRLWTSFFFLALTMAISGTARSADDRDWSAPGAEAYTQLYNSRTLTAFDGIVVSIGRFAPAKESSAGLLIVVELASGERRTVLLGPEWFMKERGLSLAKKDLVSVSGSRVSYQNKPVVIADEITSGDRTLVLRARGVWIWSSDALPPSS